MLKIDPPSGAAYLKDLSLRTEFQMRAGLPKREPEILQKWKDIDIYARLREARQDAEPFIFMTDRPMLMGSFI